MACAAFVGGWCLLILVASQAARSDDAFLPACPEEQPTNCGQPAGSIVASSGQSAPERAIYPGRGCSSGKRSSAHALARLPATRCCCVIDAAAAVDNEVVVDDVAMIDDEDDDDDGG